MGGPLTSSTLKNQVTGAFSGKSSSNILSSPIIKELHQIGLVKKATIPTISSKRGLVYVPNTTHPEDDLVWIQPGSDLGFYYNYGRIPTQKYANHLAFIPMLFGMFNNTFQADVIAQINNGAYVPYVFSFNEPDLPYHDGGSQISPADAATTWMKELQHLSAYGVKLGAPATSGSNGGITWLQQFFAACSNCTFDFLPVHWYGDFPGLASQVGYAHYLWPDLPL
ncbi:glycoside hydrolase family 128 protein [Glonium stellatum]|uniref:Glycoside hydrolase family 128 protein n=1 Tax=Glonium stellatum TaxID=574774 RepID=A0A8E2EZY9_9PEZI|nr:glycoside hydrolase family 128 protein [Glonium stellatum]